jgi:hypothetical protein
MKKKQTFLGGSMSNFSNLDFGIFKTGVALFVLFLVSVIPAFGRWVMDTHWGWFLGLFIICWIWVIKKYWEK